jgi:glycosyltransferase involved in cell wall biosynthesis
MKMHILYNFKDGAWGGGNQFLKALQKCFIKVGFYAESPEDADVILFNSHHKLNSVIKLKKRHPEKIFAHRIDGPIFRIRNCDLELDQDVFLINSNLTDVSIFQSNWSYQKCLELGYKKNRYERIIHNGADPNIFNRENRIEFAADRKIKLIATSWSDNWRKGFHLYKWLDETLDFDRYDFTFIGNSPVRFTKVQHINPLSSKELSKQLKKHDIFITASENDPCSNSLIEALSCGLPAVVKNENDGGHPELIKNGGIPFNTEQECLNAIETVANNYGRYQRNIDVDTIEKTATEYYETMYKLYKLYVREEYLPKKIDKMLSYSHKQLQLTNQIKNMVRTLYRGCSYHLHMW